MGVDPPSWGSQDSQGSSNPMHGRDRVVLDVHQGGSDSLLVALRFRVISFCRLRLFVILLTILFFIIGTSEGVEVDASSGCPQQHREVIFDNGCHIDAAAHAEIGRQGVRDRGAVTDSLGVTSRRLGLQITGTQPK